MRSVIRYLPLVIVAIAMADTDVERQVKEAQIDTDLGISAPKQLLEVKYGSQTVSLGSKLKKDEASQQPTVEFKPFHNKLATVIMVDPDAPSRANPTKRSWLHWLVVNVEGNDITTGKTVVAYNGPTPPAGSGPHRYVLLVFKQSGSIEVSAPQRPSFNIANFISDHSLTGPEYGNFYTVEVK